MSDEAKKPDLQRVLDGFPDDVKLSYASMMGVPGEDPDEVILIVSFSERGYGFGEIAIVQTPEGTIIDAETASLARVKKYFDALLDNAILDTDMDPTRHKLFNRIRGRRCGELCEVCKDDG